MQARIKPKHYRIKYHLDIVPAQLNLSINLEKEQLQFTEYREILRNVSMLCKDEIEMIFTYKLYQIHRYTPDFEEAVQV